MRCCFYLLAVPTNNGKWIQEYVIYCAKNCVFVCIVIAIFLINRRRFTAFQLFRETKRDYTTHIAMALAFMCICHDMTRAFQTHKVSFKSRSFPVQCKLFQDYAIAMLYPDLHTFSYVRLLSCTEIDCRSDCVMRIFHHWNNHFQDGWRRA